jgi:hypothetical protein
MHVWHAAREKKRIGHKLNAFLSIAQLLIENAGQRLQ